MSSSSSSSAPAMASRPPCILAVPYPGRGHVNPMINLCRLLSARGLRITFVVTEEWLRILSGADETTNFRFITIPDEVLPAESSRGADFLAFADAVLRRMAPQFDQILAGADRPDAIIADFLLHWSVAAARRRNIPVFLLWPQCASVFSTCFHLDLLAKNHHLPADLTEEMAGEIVDYIPGVPPTKMEDLPSVCFDGKLAAMMSEAMKWLPESQGLLFTSFYELEPFVFDAIRSKIQIPIFPIGPSIPSIAASPSPEANSGGCLSWLDSQPRSSVIYVSLGSFVHVAGAQMEEMERGLRMSGVRYLWVVRGSGDGRHGRGLVVPWCEQLKVLCHGSVGGFLTHCGWNSTMEGVYAGVPMLCFPLISDQFANCRLVVDEWKIGMRLRKQVGGGGGRVVVVGGEEISRSVARLMMEGEESVEMRERARELQRACRGALEDGGSSLRNLQSFIEEIMAAADRP